MGANSGSAHYGKNSRRWSSSFVTTGEFSAASTSRSCANMRAWSRRRVQRWRSWASVIGIMRGSFGKRRAPPFRCSSTRIGWHTGLLVCGVRMFCTCCGRIMRRLESALVQRATNSIVGVGILFSSAAASCSVRATWIGSRTLARHLGTMQRLRRYWRQCLSSDWTAQSIGTGAVRQHSKIDYN